MSTSFPRHFCVLFVSCLLFGCSGGGSDNDATSTDAGSDPAAAAADAPAAPAGGAPAPAGSPPSAGPRIDTSTPDGTVKEAIQAAKEIELERIWDLLPSTMQTGINDIFKTFGNQVDAELWDKSFSLLNRYVKVLISKQDMLYQTPEMQSGLEGFKSSPGASEKLDVDSVTYENLKPMLTPLLEILATILDSEISSSSRLKSFDGRKFCAKNLDPIVENLVELSKSTLAQYKKIENANPNKDLPAPVMMSINFENSMSQQFNVRTESINGDSAVVVYESGGREEKLNFVRVDGKWIPQQMMALPFGLAMAKAQLPAIVDQINSQKDLILPVLEQLEPLVAALEKANTQDEFNTAFSNVSAQASQITGSLMEVPGFGPQFGGGSPFGSGPSFAGGRVALSPVTVKLYVTGPVTDQQMSDVIKQLEALTDDPGKAITLPSGYIGADGNPVTLQESPTAVESPQTLTARTINALQITPVSDPQAFADSITFAENVEFNPGTRIISLTLKFEPPPQPAETSGTESSGRN